MPSIYSTPNTNKICYMILPEGIREGLDMGLKELAGKFGVSIVVIPGAACRGFQLQRYIKKE